MPPTEKKSLITPTKKSGWKKFKRHPSDDPHSRYTKTKERCHDINVRIFLTDEQKRRLILAVEFHHPRILKDFLLDNSWPVVDKILEEHPEFIERVYKHPDMYRPKWEEENIFKPKEVIFDIVIEEESKEEKKDGYTDNTKSN